MIDCQTSNGLCVLRLNSPPVNAISLPLLAELPGPSARPTPTRMSAPSRSPVERRTSCAGADMGDFQAIRSGDDAIRMATTFQEAFQEIEDSLKPVIAAVAGNVLGGALELAMSCHFRIAAEGSKFGMPEIKLGINPGTGGTQRLPRLVGLPAALEMLLAGQSIEAQRALALGLVDRVCPGSALDTGAEVIGIAGSAVRNTSRRTERIADAQVNSASFAQAEAIVAALRPEIIAPRTILAAVRAGVEESFAAGLAAERGGFRDCMATLATQNKFYVFAATQALRQDRGRRRLASR